MNWLSRLKVKTRLTVSFILVAIIAAIIGAVGLSSISRIHTMAERMHEFELQGLYQVGRADAELRSTGRALRGTLLAPVGQVREAAANQTQEHFRKLQAIGSEASQYFVTDAGQEQVRQMNQLVREYHAAANKVLEQARQNYFGAEMRAREILAEEARPKGDAAEAKILELLDRKRQNASDFESQIDEVRERTIIAVALLTLLGVILAVLMGYLLARWISRQLGGEPAEVVTIAEAISQGDLTVRINTDGISNHSVMFRMAEMRDSLRRLVGSVLSSSSSIASGASQISAGNTDLSQRTEEQAANLTETASAMEQLAGTVKNNADVARQAATRAMAASRSAENGGEVVGNVVQTMAGINDSSKRIVDIISVIDSIAFQTNILALNAAVEAARAGEQGRGFAVVAGEVRSLAQKSAAAAKDIKQLIDDNVEKIDAGSKLVDIAGETMSGIVNDVKQVTDLISEISAATSEQTSGISQVNDAVLQLSDVTQQNAALVEESAAASSSLNDQAQRLVELVRVFRLESGHQGYAQGQNQGQAAGRPEAQRVISVPPAVIEEGTPRTGRPSAQPRGAGAGSGTRGAGAAAGRPSTSPARPGATPAALGTAATAKAGSTVYGPGASKEDDWEEF